MMGRSDQDGCSDERLQQHPRRFGLQRLLGQHHRADLAAELLGQAAGRGGAGDAVAVGAEEVGHQGGVAAGGHVHRHGRLGGGPTGERVVNHHRCWSGGAALPGPRSGARPRGCPGTHAGGC